MALLTIIRDNREQKGWDFEQFPVEVVDATIKTGDYTLPELCDQDENDTYHPTFAVERKGGKDFASSIHGDRDRFKAEIKRASDWEEPLPVLIEEPRRTFKRQSGFMKYNNLHWPQVEGTVDSWEKYYNVDFRFTGGSVRAERIAYDLLSDQLSRLLVG
jgi:ERCC4-type nuclease